MNSYVKTFLRGSAVSLLGAGILGIANYLIRRILCNNMSLQDYGVFYSTFSLFIMIFGVADLGLTQSGTVMIAAAADDPYRRNTVFSQLFFIKSGLAVLSAAGLFLFCRIVQPELNRIFTAIFLAYFIFQALNGTLQALWGGLKKYTIQQIGYCAVAVLTLLPLCFLTEIDLTSAAGCFLFAALTAMVFSLLYSRISGLGQLQFSLNTEVSKILLTTGGLIAITTTLLSLMYNISTIMLHARQGAASAGLYNIALPIMQIVQAAMVFPGVFLPIAVEMSKKSEYTKLRAFVRTALLTALAALVPTGLFFHYCSPWLIRILFKPEYTGAAHATTLLCLGLVFFTLGNLLFQIMLSLQQTVIMAVIAGITAGSCLLLNYVLINCADVEGAAGATCISYLIFAFLTYAVLEYHLKRMTHKKAEEKCA